MLVWKQDLCLPQHILILTWTILDVLCNVYVRCMPYLCWTQGQVDDKVYLILKLYQSSSCFDDHNFWPLNCKPICIRFLWKKMYLFSGWTRKRFQFFLNFFYYTWLKLRMDCSETAGGLILLCYHGSNLACVGWGACCHTNVSSAPVFVKLCHTNVHAYFCVTVEITQPYQAKMSAPAIPGA